MKLNMNVEELRREILEGAKAIKLAQSEHSEKGCYAGREDREEKETSVTGVATEAGDGEEVEEETSVLHSVEVELREVGLEEGMLGWWG